MLSKGFHNKVILNNKDLSTHCFYCETNFKDVRVKHMDIPKKTIDHFFPQHSFSSHANFNKVICCFTCNQLKMGLYPFELIEMLEDMIILKEFPENFDEIKITNFYKNAKFIFDEMNDKPNLRQRTHRNQGYFLIKEL